MTGKENAWANTSESDRSALVDFHFQMIGYEAHHAGRLNPGNLFELCFLLREGNEENVAADVGAHDLHDLGLGDVLVAGDFNAVARVNAEAP